MNPLHTNDFWVIDSILIGFGRGSRLPIDNSAFGWIPAGDGASRAGS